MQYWQLGEAHYWGHNAIIRTRAFAANCGLPDLSGKPPFGGHVLSHDFVEAALIRRAGWSVYMLPDLQGSYEETSDNYLQASQSDRPDLVQAPEYMVQSLLDTESTVPVGTNRRLAERLAAGTRQRFDVASNPEFLKEGAAVEDFLKPDRVVIGADDELFEAVRRVAPRRIYCTHGPESFVARLQDAGFDAESGRPNPFAALQKLRDGSG